MAALQTLASREAALGLSPVPWRDPHAVSPVELAGYIGQLEAACAVEPFSPDLRTCLGMAYAMNYEVYKSMDALETARRLDPGHFFAQFKYAELQYRLRVLDRAEEETLKALDLASGYWQAALCRHQLQEVRRLKREGTQKPAWTKPLKWPALSMSILFVLLSLVTLWR